MIARLFSWIHHQPQPAWGDPYRTSATVQEDPVAREAEEDIDAPPAVSVGTGRIGPDEIPRVPPSIFAVALLAGLAVFMAILIVALGRPDCRTAIVNDSQGEPSVQRLCR